MTLAKVCSVCGLAALLFGIVFAGAWEVDDYERRHKPMAQAMWAWMEFDKCREDVREAQLRVCADLQIPPERCPIDLSQCDKYKEKE